MHRSQRRPQTKNRSRQRPLRFESLEDRRLLAITVSTLSDLIDGNITPGNYSLREAIANAAPGETINFSVVGTINLTAGQLAINKSLTINGPGAGVLTIHGQNSSRIFDVQADALVVNIGGLTLTGGRAPTGQNGGAVRAQTAGAVSIHDAVIDANFAGGGGTGFGGSGGGVWASGSLTIAGSTVSNNFAGAGGVGANGNFGFNGGSGGGVFSSGSLAIYDSTINGNRTGNGGSGGLSEGGDGDGGGVFSSGALDFTNVTISGNSAYGRGGGLMTTGSASPTIFCTTITANVANFDADGGTGGGIFRTGAAPAAISNSIIAVNFQGGTRDDAKGAIQLNDSLLGDFVGTILTDLGGNKIGTHAEPIDPMLKPLADNGGPTRTHSLKPLSPAVNAGDPAALAGQLGVPNFDQRGASFPRVVAGRIDIGAVERTPETLVVNTLVDESDGHVDDGDVSLRDALAAAGPGDTITFSVTGAIVLTMGQLNVSQTLQIVGPGAKLLTIDASGNDPTPATDNGDGSRIMEIDDGTDAALPVLITGLTFTGADYKMVDDGQFKAGALFNNESLTLVACEVRGNSTLSGYGGGLASYGPVVIQNCTFAENIAGGGGGIYVTSTALVENTTIANNTAYSSGGGVIAFSADATFRHSTIAGNTALEPNPGSGGAGGGVIGAGLAFYRLRFYSCIVAGNTGGDVSTLFTSFNAFESLGYNVIGHGDAVDAFDHPGDRPYITNPLLGALADNGGPTRTRMPLPGSPAVGQGDPTAAAGADGTPQFDQRGNGFGRIVGRIDVGAVESTLQPLVVNTLIDEADGSVADGDVSLRDALAAATPFSLITFAVTGTIPLTLGQLNVTRDLVIDGPGAQLLTIDASVKDPTPLVNDGLGIRAFRIDDTQGGVLDVSIRNLRVTGGDVDGAGGAIYSDSDLLLYGAQIDDNHSSLFGGGVSIDNKTTIVRTTIQNNSTRANQADGGGVASFGRLTIVDSTIANNRTEGAESDGGGALAVGEAVVTRSRITGNTTAGQGADGAGLAVVGNITLVDSTVSGNTVAGNFAYGGGIVAIVRTVSPGVIIDGHVSLIRSTISGNLVSGLNGDGGGVYTQGNLTLSNSTISGNRVTGQFGYGGGASVRGAIEIVQSTIADNRSELASGGGVFQQNTAANSPFTLSGSIVAGNASGLAGPDVFRDPDVSLVASYSLIGNTAGSGITAATGTGNVLNVPALLAPLADNSGLTRTHALLPGSPAINAGDPGALAYSPINDQRGAPRLRFVGGRIDIGALEDQAIPASADFNDDHDVDGQDFLAWQRGFGAVAPNGTHANGDADYDHNVAAADLAIWRSQFGAAALPAQEQAIVIDSEPTAIQPEAFDAALALMQLDNFPQSRPLFRPRTVRPR